MLAALLSILAVAVPARAGELPQGQAALSAWLLDGGGDLALRHAEGLRGGAPLAGWIIGAMVAEPYKTREVIVRAGQQLARSDCVPFASYLWRRAAGRTDTPPSDPCPGEGGAPYQRPPDLPLGIAARHAAAVAAIATLSDPIPYDPARHATLDGETLLAVQVAWTGLRARAAPTERPKVEALVRGALDHGATFPDDGLRDDLDRAVRAAAVAPPQVAGPLLMMGLAEGLTWADADAACVLTLKLAVRGDPTWEQVSACRWEPIVQLTRPPGPLPGLEALVRRWDPAAWLWPADPAGVDAERWLLARGALGVYARVYAGAEAKLVDRLTRPFTDWVAGPR